MVDGLTQIVSNHLSIDFPNPASPNPTPLVLQYKGKSTAKGVAPTDQVDVYERKVQWSAVPQLRSVVEAAFTCDEVFEFLRNNFEVSAESQKLAEMVEHGAEARAAEGRVIYPFSVVEEDFAICLRYQEVLLPWPFVPRYLFIVQDYVRIQALDGSATPSFVTYNHEAVHPYFAKREGFQRLSVKFQGLVGVPVGPSSTSTKSTTSRLTWVSLERRNCPGRARGGTLCQRVRLPLSSFLALLCSVRVKSKTERDLSFLLCTFFATLR